MTYLVPVSEWVWNKYEVQFWTAHPHEGAVGLIKTLELVCTDTHVDHMINERASLIGGCNWYQWEILEERVQAPKAIGSLYGKTLYGDGWDL